MRLLFSGLLGVLLLLGLVPPSPSQFLHVAKTPPRTPEEERPLLRVPPGFEVQLVAAEPQIRKPMNLAFDARGRLWVTDTIEYPFPAPQGRPGRDSIKILEDFDEHGRARKVTTFAEGLNIPIGLMPLTPNPSPPRGEGGQSSPLSPRGRGVGGEGCIVFSIPNVYRLRDTDGDGRADQREVLYGPFGQEDTHGMVNAFTWGFDGWLYACHGFRNTSTVKGADGAAITMQSGNVFRMHVDGSRVEQYTWGQVNPFGLAFDPLGNLFSADCHTRPLMMLLRGGYYRSFGKPHDGLGFAPEICNHSHGSTAIAGITYYAADHFPPSYQDTLFLGNVVTNRINHDRLERHGSTYRAVEQPDFLVSTDPWFRPVDLKLGPDGALYVADFYNRIIGHYEVPLTHPGRDRERGRIWRIVYRGPQTKPAEGVRSPRAPRCDWTKASVAELLQDLTHPNLTVRTLAANALTERGRVAAAAVRRVLADPRSKATQRAHGLWVLERLGVLDEGTLLSCLADADPAVRVHAVRVLAERRELLPVFQSVLGTALRDPDAFVQRAAADALGRHPAVANIRPLLELRSKVPPADTQLLHTARMALREQLRPHLAWSQLAAVIRTDADQHALADVAAGVHSAGAADFLLSYLEGRSAKPADVQRFLHHIARHGSAETLDRVVALGRKDRPNNLGHQAALLRAVQQGTQERGGKLNPEARAWAVDVVDRLFASIDERLVQTGVELAGTLRLEEKQPLLVRFAGDRRKPEAQRSGALASLAAIAPRKHVSLLGKFIPDVTESLSLRERTIQVLAGINLPQARAELVKHLPAAPARLQNVIAFGLAGRREGAGLLLQTIAAGQASARLLQEPGVVIRLQNAKLPNLPETIARLTAGLPPADQRLRDLYQRRHQGFLAMKTDAGVGAQVFEKHCAACHQVGDKGAKVGPQLDGIGMRGVDRLLEDLLDPSRNVDQAFRTTTLALSSGQLVSGLLLREDGEVHVLVDSQGKEVRVPKALVEEQNKSLLSPMPSNLVDQIPETEFYHLLAFLLKQRVVKPSATGSGSRYP